MSLIEHVGIVGIVLALGALIRRRSRSRAKECVTVEVSRFWYAAARNPIVSFVVGALTGVAITFAPIFLFFLGRGGADLFDWRVVACFATTYFVGMTYTALGAPIMRHARNSRRAQAPMV
jgi:hypothetical protein